MLQRLVRMDTVNPPGNERPAQEYLAGLLERAGFEVSWSAGSGAPEPGRAPARQGGGPVLGLLSHVDTVVADPPAGATDPGRAPSTRAACGAGGRST